VIPVPQVHQGGADGHVVEVSGWERLRAVRQWRAAPGGWVSGWDVTDRARMADLRARLAGWLIVAGAAPAVRGAVTGPAGASRAAVAAVVVLAPMPVIGALLLWRRGRVTEAAFGASLTVVVVLVATARLLTERVGSPAAQDLTFMIPLMLGAVFFERRRTLAVQIAVSVAGSSADTWHRLSHDPAVLQVLMANAFTFVTLAVVIRVLRDLAHLAVARAKIGEVTDPLTGLLNRRGFERSGGDSWRKRALQHLPLVLLVVDVDHFKRVNDTLGHAAGDELLRRLGDLLTSTLRDGDHAFRLGGEEFAILARCQPGQAEAIAERVRQRVERELPVTVSIGAVEVLPAPVQDPGQVLWDVVDQADTGLYAAKTAGRNTVRMVEAATTG